MAKLEKQQEAIKLRVAERMSGRAIAKKLDVHKGTISRWLKNHPLTDEELRTTFLSGNSRASLEPKFRVTEGNCINGHVSPKRLIGSGSCIECKRERELRRHYREHRAFPEKHMWKNARSRSMRFDVPFAITVEDIKSVWPKDNRCPILGLMFEVGRNKGPDRDSPTLDRIIPSLGYVVGNIAILSHRANAMKNDETQPAMFRKLADWLEGMLEKRKTAT